MAERHCLNCCGLTLSCLQAGAGTPVVLLHGIGSGAASWQAQLDTLSRNYRVAAWDAPGYGESASFDTDKPQASDYAEVLNALVEGLGLQSFYLVGHSLGALIAASFARRWPQKLLGLVLADPAQGYARAEAALREQRLSSRLDAFRRLGAAGVARSRGPRLLSSSASSAAVNLVCEVMSRLRETGYTHAAQMLASGDLLADARGYAGRVLVVCGADDQITPPEGARQLAASMANANYRELAAAGHACYVEQPQAFNQLVIEYFNEMAKATVLSQEASGNAIGTGK